MSTVVIRGSTENIMDDIERAVDDGVNTFKALTRDDRFVPGGGATEIELAKQISSFGEVCRVQRKNAFKVPVLLLHDSRILKYLVSIYLAISFVDLIVYNLCVAMISFPSARNERNRLGQEKKLYYTLVMLSFGVILMYLFTV